ncbi:MAG TPA: LytTR family DNA-binding domain-containing protein [Stellaceae bacterium]|nr:LytTR family DNA-binding domain-containing protein [Stellaceae bacterium]
MSGDALWPSGIARRTLSYGYAAAVAGVGAVNAINVITTHHDEPRYGLAAPIIWEGTSWVTFITFLFIAWLAYRIAPPAVRPRWKLLVHAPAVALFSLGHVAGFIALRKLIYWLGGASYHYGALFGNFAYELGKDAFGYVLFVAALALIEHLLRQPSPVETPTRTPTFDIRDGAKLTRVRLDHILAVASAGNYVEFVLAGGRRLLMRAPLTAIERELGSRGFLRTHRSWLVNAAQVTALRPEGSGDYAVELGSVTVPLSRRFPEALARLRSGVAAPRAPV